jgi:hypothetical protein
MDLARSPEFLFLEEPLSRFEAEERALARGLELRKHQEFKRVQALETASRSEDGQKKQLTPAKKFARSW